MFRGNSPQYISPSRSPDRPLRGVRPAPLEHKRKAPRSAGNPWSSPAGPRSRTARDRGAHRSAAAALGYPVCGVATAPPECRSPLRGRHLRRTRTMVFHRITSFAGRVSQAAGPNPPGHRAAQARRQPPRPASRRGTSVLLMVGHPAPDVNLRGYVAANRRPVLMRSATCFGSLIPAPRLVVADGQRYAGSQPVPMRAAVRGSSPKSDSVRLTSIGAVQRSGRSSSVAKDDPRRVRPVLRSSGRCSSQYQQESSGCPAVPSPTRRQQ